MDWDDEVCLCFHVSKRKIANWIRIERPQRAPQIADCGGAGTGCGWCRPMLETLFRQAALDRESQHSTPEHLPDQIIPEELSATDYATQRQSYLARKKTADNSKISPGSTGQDS